MLNTSMARYSRFWAGFAKCFASTHLPGRHVEVENHLSFLEPPLVILISWCGTGNCRSELVSWDTGLSKASYRWQAPRLESQRPLSHLGWGKRGRICFPLIARSHLDWRRIWRGWRSPSRPKGFGAWKFLRLKLGIECSHEYLQLAHFSLFHFGTAKCPLPSILEAVSHPLYSFQVWSVLFVLSSFVR